MLCECTCVSVCLCGVCNVYACAAGLGLLASLGRAPLEDRHPALFMVSLVLLGPACGMNEAMMKDKPLSEEKPLDEPGLCRAG